MSIPLIGKNSRLLKTINKCGLPAQEVKCDTDGACQHPNHRQSTASAPTHEYLDPRRDGKHPNRNKLSECTVKRFMAEKS